MFMLHAKTVAPGLALLFSLGCLAQSPAAAPPSFEAASIRTSTMARTQDVHVETTPGNITVRGASLGFFIQWAYDMPQFQVTGPAWLSTTGFDIVAKAATPADDDHMRLMMRTLLAERFGVKVHSERKEMQVYELTLAKGGPKFHEATTEGPPNFTNAGKGMLVAERVTMADLASKISEPLGRPVLDATGLKGRYDIHIDARPYMTATGNEGGGPMDVMSILFTALQDQLGVKLESRKDTPEILIVDSAEKTPTEN
jgi:uncharacterized protein (TIGR03435 family)